MGGAVVGIGESGRVGGLGVRPVAAKNSRGWSPQWVLDCETWWGLVADDGLAIFGGDGQHRDVFTFSAEDDEGDAVFAVVRVSCHVAIDADFVTVGIDMVASGAVVVVLVDIHGAVGGLVMFTFWAS